MARHGKQKLENHILSHAVCCHMQNVKPEKLFSKEQAVKQLLDIIDSTTTQSNGKFYAWDKREIPW